MAHAGLLRPMGLLEIIDQTFRLYRSNFWLFFGISAVVYLPFGLINLLPGAALLLMPALLLVVGALTKAVSDRYLGQAASVGVSYAYVARRLLPFVGTMIVSYVFVMLGVLLLFVGAIVFGFWIAFITEVFILEDKRYFAAIWRSKFLIGKGVWAEVLGLGIIVGILTMLIQAAAGLALGAPFLFLTGEEAEVYWLAQGLISGLVQSLVAPIGLVASILLYYDSRIRKEGFDLEVLAREMGLEPAAVPGAETPQIPPMPPSGSEEKVE